MQVGTRDPAQANRRPSQNFAGTLEKEVLYFPWVYKAGSI